MATITMKDGTTVRAELFEDVSPNSVCNFIKLANEGFYDGTYVIGVFHNALIMGSPTGDKQGNAGYAIKGEFAANGFDNSDTKFDPGTMVMYRLGDYNSASCIFQIVTESRPELVTRYAPIGKVLEEDLEKLDIIADVDRDYAGVPAQPVVIDSIRVETYGKTYPAPETVPLAQ
nr:peptidylprolyl isomerase [bacterium]